MSLQERNNAINIIADALRTAEYSDTINHSGIANYVLNQLMRAGYTNDKITVHAPEMEELFNNSPFKCKSEDRE